MRLFSLQIPSHPGVDVCHLFQRNMDAKPIVNEKDHCIDGHPCLISANVILELPVCLINHKVLNKVFGPFQNYFGVHRQSCMDNF